MTEIVCCVSVSFTNVSASGTRSLNGSNPNLLEEHSYSLTAGFVAQPRFVPAGAANFNVNLNFGKFEIGYRMRVIDKQSIRTMASIRMTHGRPPTNPDAFPREFYSRVVYRTIRAGVNVSEWSRVYGGIVNVTDRHTPRGLDGTPSGSVTFVIVGRVFYIGAGAKF